MFSALWSNLGDEVGHFRICKWLYRVCVCGTFARSDGKTSTTSMVLGVLNVVLSLIGSELCCMACAAGSPLEDSLAPAGSTLEHFPQTRSL